MTDTDQMNCALSQARPEILCVPLDTDLHRCPLYDNNPDVGPRVLRSSVSDSAICTQKGIRVMSTTFAIRGNARSSKETCCAMKHFSWKLP